MRLRPASRRPRTVFAAVRLMCAGAAVDLAALITVVVTADSVKSAVVQKDRRSGPLCSPISPPLKSAHPSR